MTQVKLLILNFRFTQNLLSRWRPWQVRDRFLTEPRLLNPRLPRRPGSLRPAERRGRAGERGISTRCTHTQVYTLAKCVCCVGEAIKCACAFLGRANQCMVVRPTGTIFAYFPPLKRNVLSNFRTARKPDVLGRNSYGLVYRISSGCRKRGSPTPLATLNA